MQFIQRYHDNSLVYGCPQADRSRQGGRDTASPVVMGHSEKHQGSLYMAQWIHRPGRRDDRQAAQAQAHARRAHRLRRRRRQRPGRSRHRARPASAALCCWEHLQPLSKYAMYAQNEQVHVAAWPSFSLYRGGAHALGPEVNNAASQIYAVEGQLLRRRSVCDGDRRDGGSSAVHRRHEEDAPAPGRRLRPHLRARRPAHAREPLAENAEGLVYADLDLGLISLAKAAADPSGHYARPDVTQLLFNRTPRRAVVTSPREPTTARRRARPRPGDEPMIPA